MALQTIPGEGVMLPSPTLFAGGGSVAFESGLLIDATGEKIALCGRVFNKDRSTKTINKVHFRFGAVTKAGGSNLIVSLQDQALAIPAQPDETQDQYRAIANADITANTWFTSGLITSDGTDTGSKRSVAFNERLCVVVEFDGSGRQGSDSFVVNGVTASATSNIVSSSLKTSGAWATAMGVPNILFEFSDGTFGTFHNTRPMSAINSHAYKQDTAGADEYALEFQVPWPCTVDGGWAFLSAAAATSDYDIILYDGTNPMASGSVSIDGGEHSSTNNRYTVFGFPAGVTLAANTTYRLAFKPTQTTSSITVISYDVAAADHFQAHPGGTAFTFTTRLNEGSWASPTTTRRLMAGIRISAFDDGAGGGAAGMLYAPGMEGLG